LLVKCPVVFNVKISSVSQNFRIGKGQFVDYKLHAVSLAVLSRTVALIYVYLVDAAEATDTNKPT
jgi:hypothetical protein